MEAIIPPGGDRGTGHARRLAAGSLAQQLAQVSGLVAMFAIVTVLARHLSLGQLGVYGVLNSIAGYLLIVQNAGASAAVRAMAAADDREARDRAFSTAVSLYAGAGLLAGLLVAALGALLSMGLDLAPDVERQARLGALLLGLVTAVGWPLTAYRDALRAEALFVRAATMEIAALAVYATLVLSLAVGGAELSLIVAASGTIPLLVGIGCMVAAWASRSSPRLSPRHVDRRVAREMGSLAGYVSGAEAALAATFAVNRVILGLFRSATTVGLYEGPVRAHGLLRALGAAVTVTVLPAAARFHAQGDERRLRELATQAVRFTVALTAPLAVTGIVLAAPLLDLWLGDGFRAAAPALAILLVPWLVQGCGGALGALLVGCGRGRLLARWAGSVAVANVALALVLAPTLGLEGIALATALPYGLLFPVLFAAAAQAGGVEPMELARRALWPALSMVVPLAGALALVRFGLPIERPGVLVAAGLSAPLAYWAAFYVLWLSPEDRSMIRTLGRRDP